MKRTYLILAEETDRTDANTFDLVGVAPRVEVRQAIEVGSFEQGQWNNLSSGMTSIKNHVLSVADDGA